MSKTSDKILPFFNILLCIGIVGWGSPILYNNRKLYLDENQCNDYNDELVKILFSTIGIGVLGIIYKCFCCGLDKLIYWLYIILGVILLSFNLNFYNKLNSTCKTFYKSDYSDIWTYYLGSIIYLFLILFIGIINLLKLIYNISYCSK